MNSPDDDLLSIIDDREELAAEPTKAPWRILIIDDDEDVHATTSIALGHTHILNRPLALEHCYSASEARDMLTHDQNFAVILLDVVMENEHAGLDMVGYIRDTLDMQATRIILRTGQPGYAPELTIFNHYDIDDYRTKSELTRTRLITCITSALRSYRQIRALSRQREGLEKIITASADLMEKTALNTFAEGILTQMASLLDFHDEDGVVCVQRHVDVDESLRDQLFIVAAVGTLTHYVTRPLSELRRPDISAAIRTCLEQKRHLFNGDHVVIYLQSGDTEGAIYLHTEQVPKGDDQQLIEVFAANISSCYGNVQLVDKLNYVAYHDTLTRAPNRTRFILELDQVAKEQNPDTTVALLDLTHFADLNEGLGLDAGNTLLIAIAGRLKRELGDATFVARIGADVFGLIGHQRLINPSTLDSIFAIPFHIEQMDIPVRCNIGFCRLLYGDMKGLTLLKRADIALTRSKKSTARNYEYYIEEMENDARWRLDIIHQLHYDHYGQQLELWYQPQVHLQTGAIYGIEALMRWPDSAGGFTQPPSVFIPLAEYSGLIIELGDWALEEACKTYRQLQDEQLAPPSVSVNVSVPQFKSARFTEHVRALIQKYQMPEGALVLEVTESLAMDDPKRVISMLSTLRNAGVRSSIDDFGTGYSSLGYLRNLPADCLKIDQSFIRELSHEEHSTSGLFADTIITLGEKLGLNVVAEGVETAEQARFLRELGCQIAQGFYYAKPMPLPALKRWLKDYQEALLNHPKP